jgi:tight adherence protein C
LLRLGRRSVRTAPGDLGARLEAGGVSLPAADFAAIRAGAALVGLLAVLPFAWAAPGRSAVVVLLAGPAAGYLGPGWWLGRRTRRRAATIEAELADVLDLLRVALAAGLAAPRALAEVGRRHPGTLAAELRRAAARRALGLSAERVIGELERRCPGEGVAALCASLRRAQRHGAPLADALGAQARQARARTAARTAEAAARAAPRIQLAVALLLVPSAAGGRLGGWAALPQPHREPGAQAVSVLLGPRRHHVERLQVRLRLLVIGLAARASGLGQRQDWGDRDE